MRDRAISNGVNRAQDGVPCAELLKRKSHADKADGATDWQRRWYVVQRALWVGKLKDKELRLLKRGKKADGREDAQIETPRQLRQRSILIASITLRERRWRPPTQHVCHAHLAPQRL